MSPVVRSIDVGFGQTKYVTAATGKVVECAQFPSVAFPGMVDTSQRSVLGGRRRTVSIPVGSMFYEVGPEIDLAGGQHRPPLPIDGYVTSPEHLALLRGALHHMNVSHIDLLVLGLPVAVFIQRKAQLEKLATGEHNVGKGRTVTVARALALAQPQGALVTYAVQHDSLGAIKHQESLIIDAGSRTFDWLCARGLRLVSNRSHSAPYGAHDVASKIAEAVSHEIGEHYDDLDAIDLALRKQKPLSLFGKAHPIARYRPVVDSIAQEAVRAMAMSIGGKYRFDNIVLVGGAAHLFKRALAQAFPRQPLHEVAEPIFANVRGFQHAGMERLGVSALGAGLQQQGAEE